MEDVNLIDDDAFLMQNDKVEIIDDINNTLNRLKASTRKSIYTVAIVQYVAIVAFIWAVLYFLIAK
jgi:t-SNARE complex subunit (syntaxin)